MDSLVTSLQDPVSLTLLSLTTVILIYYLLKNTSTSAYPDGPPTIPILGNLHQLLMAKDMNLIHFLEDNRRKYGNAYTIELGGVKRVVISGYDVMQELLVKNADYSSLRKTDSMPASYTAIAEKTPGIVWAKYPGWKTMRLFALSNLREEGMGKSSLEPQIMYEIHAYIDHFIKPHLGQPISLSDSLMMATANVVGAMLHGNRNDYDNPNFKLWMRKFQSSIKAALKAALARNIPFAMHLPGDLAGVKANMDAASILIPAANKDVAARKFILDFDNPSTYVDRFLLRAAKEKKNGNQDIIFSDENISIVMIQLYGAGTETTSTALRWALLYMCAYPEIQTRVHEEIDSVLGSKEVGYQDRLNLPYVEAVLLETLRLSNISPTALPHTLEQETVVEGKRIPAGTELMLNMASVLWDEDIFEEPSRFKPERYLEGDISLKKARTIPFGIGRRACVGESLARMELVLFFTTFMQKFTVSLPTGEEPDLKGICLLVNSPGDYRLIFSER